MSMEDYIEQHIDEEPDYLRRLYRDANLQLLYTRMMSGHIQGRFLKMVTEMIKPKRVLEIGTYAGYATLCIADGLPDAGIIDTIEKDDELTEFIRGHFQGTPNERKIRLHIGDALKVIPILHSEGGKWDMVYIDGDKREYPAYYRLLLPMMKDGGWMLVDNTLWSGKVVEAAKGLRGQNKDPQLDALLEFNDIVSQDDRVEKLILPVRDGLTIIKIKG